MSVLSVTSAVTEVPGVNNAVEHLQELAARMISDDFGFKVDDVANIDRIIDAIQDLETDRANFHELLEVETIEASKLRHRLKFLPGQIKDEIQDAINSARQSNADELNRLQAKLDAINENISYLEEKHRRLEQENAVLHPERDKVRQEHEEVIMQLNQRMSEKASKQIVLNETRDHLRETNVKIVDLEEGILQLKEDLIQERADARHEKKRLKKAVYDTTLKTREQKEVNITKKREMDELQQRVMESENQLDEIRKSVRRYETSKSKLEGQERALSAAYNRECKQNEELQQKGKDIWNETMMEQDIFEGKRVDMENKLSQLEKDMERERAKNETLKLKKHELDDQLADRTKIRQKDARRVKEANAQLQEMKQDFARKAEEVARLTQENIDAELRMTEINDSHDAIIHTLSKQIEEARETLAKERTERMEIQSERNQQSKEIEQFRTDNKKLLADMNRKINEGKMYHEKLTKELQGKRDEQYMIIDKFKVTNTRELTDMNRTINQGKKKHDQLSEEGQQLRKAIREDDERIKSLRSREEQLKKDYSAEKDKLLKKVKLLEDEISEMETQKAGQEKFLEEKLPGFAELETNFEETTKSYEAMKKEIVGKKNKRLGLEDAIKRAKRDLEKLANPKLELENKLKNKRAEAIEKMKRQSEEINEIEREVYTAGHRLKTLVQENIRFKESNERLEAEIVRMKQEKELNEQLKQEMSMFAKNLKGLINEEWKKDKKMGDAYAAKDELLVLQLESLLHHVTKRETIISDVTERLQSELDVLSEFLDNVARRRPKESRKGRRERLQTEQRQSILEGNAGSGSEEEDNDMITAPLPPTPKMGWTTPKPLPAIGSFVEDVNTSVEDSHGKSVQIETLPSNNLEEEKDAGT